MKVLSIETKVLYVLVKSKPNWVIYWSAKHSWTHVRFRTETKSRNAV